MDQEFILSDDFDVQLKVGEQVINYIGTIDTYVVLCTESNFEQVLTNFGIDNKFSLLAMQDMRTQQYLWYYGEDYRLLFLYTEKKTIKDIRNLGVLAVNQLRKLKIVEVAFTIPKNFNTNEVKSFLQSVVLWNYKFEMKTVNKTILLKSIIFNIENILESIEELNFIITAAKSTLLVRDLVNTRANIATPQYLEDFITNMIDGENKISNFEVIKGKQLDDRGLKVFYSVGKGAAVEPRLIQCLYKGDSNSEYVKYAFVGKGITFDTGGLDIKANSEDMYCDKVGACTVLGALKGVLELKPRINIAFCLAIAENSVDANSYRPSDIITSYKGYTVEVCNTDCEGRLVLIDAFTYMQDLYKPKNLIDLASLTGAVTIALGPLTNGLFSNNEELAKFYMECGDEMCEKSWILPIFEEHKQDILSDVSDLKNMKPENKLGSASRAAAFMLNFIEFGVNWLHVDFYGPAHLKKAHPPMPELATGFNTQTILNLIRKSAS